MQKYHPLDVLLVREEEVVRELALGVPKILARLAQPVRVKHSSKLTI